jgi:hypothetical protein
MPSVDRFYLLARSPTVIGEVDGVLHAAAASVRALQASHGIVRVG